MRVKSQHRQLASMSLSVVAITLFVYSVVAGAPGEIARGVPHMLANATVGVSVGVEPNPYNTLAQELQRKESDLNEREARLVQLEGLGEDAPLFNPGLAAYSFATSIILFGLLAVNFYMDWRRGKRMSARTA